MRRVNQIDECLLGVEDIGPKATDLKAARGVLKSLPYVGSGLVIGNEIASAASGEQTWGKAVADSAGVLGGSAVGGVAGAAVCGPVVPPSGSIVCGAAGGAVGGFLGAEVADYYVPEEDVDMPQPADPIEEDMGAVWREGSR